LSERTQVNSQITDALGQTGVAVVAQAPAQALASLYQIAAHSAGLSMQNAVSNQQSLNQISTATVASAVAMILAIGNK
jgi:Killing trait